MSIFIALLGLGFLILIHEAGHFFASLAVGLRPRRFYVGFPPALVKRSRNGIEYGIGTIPLGGFVSIPGMHRPIAHDAERRFSSAVSDAPVLAGPYDRMRRALESGDHPDVLVALDDLERGLESATVTPEARRSADKGLTELRDSLGPDAYWKAATWRRLVAIIAGPAANILLALVLMTVLFMTSEGKATTQVASVVAGTPAAAMGLQAGDTVVSINGKPVDSPADIPGFISGSDGKKLTVVVLRSGEEVTLGPTAPEQTDAGYRLGFLLDAVSLGAAEAVLEAFDRTWLVTTEIVKSLGRLAVGEGREDIASPIGITQVSSDAVEQGAENYLWVLALVSLSLALLNLLPLLPLDGGHILFALLEGVRGSFVRREIYERVSVIGLAVVVLLFIIGVTNDVGRLS